MAKLGCLIPVLAGWAFCPAKIGCETRNWLAAPLPNYHTFSIPGRSPAVWRKAGKRLISASWGLGLAELGNTFATIIKVSLSGLIA